MGNRIRIEDLAEKRAIANDLLREVRFWNKVDEKGPDDCWLWTGSVDAHGYGQIGYQKKIIKAHRYSWEINNGPIPKGECVLHACDNPTCVNPRHLFLGSRPDNIIDMTFKGRHWSPLDAEKVREIRAKYSKGKYGFKKLAKEYGVNPSAIYMIVTNQTWVHIL